MDGFGFFSEAVTALKVVLILIGAGVGALGIFNLLEAYSDDNGPGKTRVSSSLCQAAVSFFLQQYLFRSLLPL